MKNIFIYCIIIFTVCSCKKYLDKKPDESLVVPSRLQDLAQLLDNNEIFNNAISLDQESADDHYVPYDRWSTIASEAYRDNYIWKGNLQNYQYWYNSYNTVFNANVVLGELDNVDPGTVTAEFNRVKGSALFYRAYALFELSGIYMRGYDADSLDTAPGLPLRLDPDYNTPSVRASMRETYQQIVGDMQEAAALLPEVPVYKTRPGKTAARAVLARMALIMGDFITAEKYADSCLMVNNILMDYNEMDMESSAPFPLFNDEVIYHTMASLPSNLANTRARVDSLLYLSYADNDLRKLGFFAMNDDNTFRFKGIYAGFAVVFKGIATDELYLIRAECRVRNNRVAEGMDDLNTLLAKRINKNSFVPLVITDQQEALSAVLQERRKELLFRGLRWTDLRRFEKLPGEHIILQRKLNDEVYVLPSASNYASLIPDMVIKRSGIPQN